MINKKYARVLSVLCLIVLLIAAVPAAFAATEYETVEVELPYKHVFITTDKTVDSLFHYVISGKDGAPLPAEADEDGRFSFKGVAGDGEKSGDNFKFDLDGTLTFHFSRPGVYTYELKADLSTDNNKTNVERYTFEQRTLTVTMYIVNASDGKLQLKMVTAEDGHGAKTSEIELDPVYKGPVKPSMPINPLDPKTGDITKTPLYMTTMLISGAAVILWMILPLWKRKGREDDAQ